MISPTPCGYTFILVLTRFSYSKCDIQHNICLGTFKYSVLPTTIPELNKLSELTVNVSPTETSKNHLHLHHSLLPRTTVHVWLSYFYECSQYLYRNVNCDCHGYPFLNASMIAITLWTYQWWLSFSDISIMAITFCMYQLRLSSFGYIN